MGESPGSARTPCPRTDGVRRDADRRPNPHHGRGVLCLAALRADDQPPFAGFDAVFAQRIAEADEFYGVLQRQIGDPDHRLVQRQALAGMLWSKQYYHLEVTRWLNGDPTQPEPPRPRRRGRNSDWRHLHNADIISLHMNLDESNRGLINKTRIAAMRKGAIIINTARGGLVVEEDIAAACQSGQLGGYGADVLNHEPPEPLKQLVSGGEAFISIQYVMQGVTLMLIKLVRRTEAEPAHIEAAKPWFDKVPPI